VARKPSKNSGGGVDGSSGDGDPWHADSSLPASEELSGLPSEAEESEESEESEAEAAGEEAEEDEAPTERPEPASAAVAAEDEPKRSKTIPRKQMLRDRRRMIAEGRLPEILEYDRPTSRSICRSAERPCLYVSCRYHLYLDVNPNTGSIKINFPELEPWELSETCALDVAERGGVTLEEVGDIMNLTRERIRQVEVTGLEKLRDTQASLETFLDGRELPIPRLPVVDD
jgi:hypothetical protein